MIEYVIAFFIGLAVSFGNNVAGGGGGMILIPAMIALGLSPIEAVATTKLGAVGFIVGSLISGEARKLTRYDHIKPLIILTMVAAVIGPLISVNLSQSHVKTISAIFIIIAAAASLITIRMPAHSRQVSRNSKYIGYFLVFITSILLSGFGSGMGLLGNYILMGFVGFSALETIGTARILGIVSLPIQLLMFVSSGHVKYDYGLILAVSGLIGAYFGLQYAIKKGDLFVKKSMAAVAILLVIAIFAEG